MNEKLNIPTIESKCDSFNRCEKLILPFNIFFFLIPRLGILIVFFLIYQRFARFRNLISTLVNCAFTTADWLKRQSIKFEGWHLQDRRALFLRSDLVSFFLLCPCTATVFVRIRWTAWYLPATVRFARIRETSRRTPRVRLCSVHWNRVNARNVANPAAKNGS